MRVWWLKLAGSIQSRVSFIKVQYYFVPLLPKRIMCVFCKSAMLLQKVPAQEPLVTEFPFQRKLSLLC